MADRNELETIRRLGADIPGVDPDAKARALQRLRQHTLEQRAPLVRIPQRRRAAGWVVATAAVVVVLIVGGVVFLQKGSPDKGPEPSAVTTLRDLALVAARQPRLIPPPGKYVYVRSEELHPVSGKDLGTGAEWTAIVHVTRHEWRSSDGSGRILTVLVGRPRFVSSADEAAWRRAGRPEVIPNVDDERFRPGELPTRDLQRLPTEVRGLRRVLEARTVVDGPPGVAETFNIIGILLEEEGAPPALRASLLEVAASLRGVETLRHHRDPLGRPALAAVLSDRRSRTILDFDPDTALLLAIETQRTAPQQPAEWRAFGTPRVVDSIRIPRPGQPSATSGP